ncbi:MAG: hypothetical protein HY093_02940 [Candidatus Liptonbacteria bacterium]|nr:hypothetical protein [Candidatus Liptonbacteria bacterium]
MKKYLGLAVVLSVLVAGFFINPGRVAAQLSDSALQALQAQIQSLLAMIQQLQQQISALQVNGGVTGQTSLGLVPPTFAGGGQVDRATRLLVGDRVQAKDSLRVRTTPNISGAALATMTLGAKGTLASSLSSDGQYWWAEVYWDNGTRGYSADDYLSPITRTASGVCGDVDVNGDGVVNILDSIWMRHYVYDGAPIPTGVNADVNADGKVDILDKTIVENYATNGGAAPTCKVNNLPPPLPPTLPSTQSVPPTSNSVTVTNPACGDLNSDGAVNVLDKVLINNYVFGGVAVPSGVKTDLNGDGRVDVLDYTSLNNYVTNGGAAPTCVPQTAVPQTAVPQTAPITECPPGQFWYASPGGDPGSCLIITSPPVAPVTSVTSVTSVTPVAPALVLYPGDRVQANDSVNVRATVNGDVTKIISPGTKGTIGGKFAWDGVYWWSQVYWDNRTVGFSVQNYLTKTAMPVSGVCGDVNGDTVVDTLDSIWMRLYVLSSWPIPTGVNADVNADHAVDILDYDIVNNYVGGNGPAPTCGTGGVKPGTPSN